MDKINWIQSLISCLIRYFNIIQVKSGESCRKFVMTKYPFSSHRFVNIFGLHFERQGKLKSHCKSNTTNLPQWRQKITHMKRTYCLKMQMKHFMQMQLNSSSHFTTIGNENKSIAKMHAQFIQINASHWENCKSYTILYYVNKTFSLNFSIPIWQNAVEMVSPTNGFQQPFMGFQFH